MITTLTKCVYALHVMDCELTERNGPGYEGMGVEYRVWCTCDAEYYVYVYSTKEVNQMIEYHLRYVHLHHRPRTSAATGSGSGVSAAT